ncbi:hypothetical protein [Nonomuraea fuscirosea]|uniref:hypothetical protein n=1 Tax=Nonomuraea fuscirosea TaxID=1291556 RepID=UPI00344530C1
MSQSVDDPPIEEAGDKAAAGSAEAEQPPQARQDKEEKPLSEEDALRALHSKGESEDEAERAEAARAAAIAASVMERLNADPFGMRIGTVALFNDAVSFGGGMNFGDGARRTGQPTARISERRIARWTVGHLPLPRFDEALRILVERRLLILALPPGGRKATGVNLLVKAVRGQAVAGQMDGEQAAGGQEAGGGCHEVLDASVLRDGQWRPPERDSGYLLVLDDTNPGLTPHLIDEQWIDDLTACLNEHGSYLVVLTGPPRGALMEAERSGQVLTTLGGLDLVRLIERRVHDREPTPEESADLRLRLIEAGALELLREDTRPRTALHLATVIRERADLAARVKELRDPTGRVHDWFSRHRTPEAMCFALAAAALEDATYLTVSDAAAQLYELLTPAAEAPPDLRFRERIGSDHPWIDVSVEPGGTPGDVAPRVRYLNPLVRQAVLGYAWTYLDGQRSAFLDWIRLLVAHPDIGVRARASVAAGVIAWSDYDHALHRFLRPWARHGSVVVRQSAATALDVVGGHPDLAEAVWLLLEAWVAEQDTAAQRRQGLTAAAVLGGGLGAAQPRRAVRALHVLLDGDDWGTLLPAGLALFRLMERGRVAEVLAALVEWSAPRDGSPMVTKALAAFVYLAAQPAIQPSVRTSAQTATQPSAQPSAQRAGEADGRSRFSSMPLLLAGAEEHRSQLIELWARALDRRPAQQPALETLRDYLDVHADHDGTAYRDVRDIVLAVAARSGRHRERLQYHLGDWARAAGRRDHPAARLLAELGRSSYANGRT